MYVHTHQIRQVRIIQSGQSSTIEDNPNGAACSLTTDDGFICPGGDEHHFQLLRGLLDLVFIIDMVGGDDGFYLRHLNMYSVSPPAYSCLFWFSFTL